MTGKLKAGIKDFWNQLQSGMLQMLTANVLNKVVAMVSNMVITRVLTKPEYGIWSYVLNIYSYVGLLTGLGLLSGAFQFGAENRGKEEEFQYYRFCLKTGVWIDTLLVVVFVLGSFFFQFPLPQAAPYLRTYIPILLLEYVLNLLLTILRCENRVKEYAHVLNVNTMLLAIGTCFGALYGVIGVIIGKYVAFVISLFQLTLRIRPEIGKLRYAKNLQWKKTGALWHYSLLTGVSSTLNTVLYLLDVSMIAAMIRSASELATYKVATLIPTALTFIPNSLVVCILPDIITNRDNVVWLRRHIKKCFLILGVINAVVCTILIILAPLVILILSGEDYLAAVPAFRILTFGYFVTGTFCMLSTNILAGLRKVNLNLIVSISSILADIILNYIFIQRFQAIGAAYATLSVEIITAILAFFFLQRSLSRT